MNIETSNDYAGADEVKVIGLNIQEPAFDLATSLSDVAFRGLERSVDTTILPIPDTGLGGV